MQVCGYSFQMVTEDNQLWVGGGNADGQAGMDNIDSAGVLHPLENSPLARLCALSGVRVTSGLQWAYPIRLGFVHPTTWAVPRQCHAWRLCCTVARLRGSSLLSLLPKDVVGLVEAWIAAGPHGMAAETLMSKG